MITFIKEQSMFKLQAGCFKASSNSLKVVCPEKVYGEKELLEGGSLCVEIINANDQSIQLQFHNKSSDEIFIDSIHLDFSPECFEAPLYSRDYRQLIHSFDFCPETGVKPVGVPKEWAKAQQPSSLVTVLSNIDTNCCIV